MAPHHPSPSLHPPTKFSIHSLSPRLLNKDKKSLAKAIAPSSEFRGGAAILARDVKFHTGCKIESPVYLGPVYLGICAKRVALFKALSE